MLRAIALLILPGALCAMAVGHDAAPVRVLNNFVSELLDQEGPLRDPKAFTNPREGFVFVQVRPGSERDPDNPPEVHIDDLGVAMRSVKGNWEGWQWLTEGLHTLRVPSTDVRRIVVRAVGELVYMTYGIPTQVAESAPGKDGRFTWQWLREHVLDNYNHIVSADPRYGGGGKPIDTPSVALEDVFREEVTQWAAEGKHWTTHFNLPFDATTADEVYASFTQRTGMQHPLMHGVWGDEFLPFGDKDTVFYPAATEAIRRMRAAPEFEGKRMYAYRGSSISPAMHEFVRVLVDSGYCLAYENYAHTTRTDEGLPFWKRPVNPLGPETPSDLV